LFFISGKRGKSYECEEGYDVKFSIFFHNDQCYKFISRQKYAKIEIDVSTFAKKSRGGIKIYG
jgi:hypothetical protein